MEETGARPAGRAEVEGRGVRSAARDRATAEVPMKHEMVLKNLPNAARLAPLFRRLAARVDPRAAESWRPTGVLHAVLEKYPTRARYRVSVVLRVPRHTLVARAEGHEAETVLHSAFLEIERQLRKEKARLRREDLWKRRAPRGRLRWAWKLEPVPRAERERGLLADLVLANLDGLYAFARREVAYHVAAGDLARDDLRLADVVDAVVLRACTEFPRRPLDLEVGPWLRRLAVEQLQAELERLGRDRAETVRIEDAVPAPGGLDGDIDDFYQPEPGLTLEDVVPDRSAPTPERVAEHHDLQRCLRAALAELPSPWRTALELHYLEELPIAEVARMTRRTEAEVRAGLDLARELLRQRIAATGLPVSA